MKTLIPAPIRGVILIVIGIFITIVGIKNGFIAQSMSARYSPDQIEGSGAVGMGALYLVIGAASVFGGIRLLQNRE